MLALGIDLGVMKLDTSAPQGTVVVAQQAMRSTQTRTWRIAYTSRRSRKQTCFVAPAYMTGGLWDM